MTTQMPVEAGGIGSIEALGPVALTEFISCSARMEEELEQIATAIQGRLQDLVSGWPAEAVFASGEASDCLHRSLGAQIRSFRRGSLPEACPKADVACAETAAKIGTLKLLLDGYRTIQTGVWQFWFELVEGCAPDPETRDELLRHGMEFFTRYAELLRERVTEVFQGAIEQMSRGGDQRRLHAVRAMLEGRQDEADQLDVDPEQHHLGVVAEGAEGELAVRQLAEALQRPLLMVGPIGRSWWAWIAGSRPLAAADERVLRGFVPIADARLAVGLEAFGAEGFRSTHKQAIRAQAVAGKAPEPLTYFGDVAVTALASASLGDARAFVLHELRGIDQETPGDQRIRETILAYFAAGHNAASAAAALGVHQQTVTNRLLAAEERLGRSVASRRVELETALRLRSLLRAEPG
jgi:hypothetical protein